MPGLTMAGHKLERSQGQYNTVLDARTCPRPCIPHHKTARHDSTGRAIGTDCSLCGQFVARTAWLTELTGVNPW